MNKHDCFPIKLYLWVLTFEISCNCLVSQNITVLSFFSPQPFKNAKAFLVCQLTICPGDHSLPWTKAKSLEFVLILFLFVFSHKTNSLKILVSIFVKWEIIVIALFPFRIVGKIERGHGYKRILKKVMCHTDIKYWLCCDLYQECIWLPVAESWINSGCNHEDI